MMTLNSSALISDLLELERQIAGAPRHVGALRAAFATASDDKQARLRRAHLEADSHLRVLVATIQRIKAQVVPQDGLGAALGSTLELVLRSQRRIVLAEIAVLRDLANESPARERVNTLALGPFEQFEDWLSYVAHQVNGFSQWWIGYRGHAAEGREAYRDTLRNSAEEREAYRDAVRSAHAAMRQLGRASKATPLLLDAISATDWPVLQTPCSRISSALSIHIDVDPDQPLLVFPLSQSMRERLG
jgi:hypothetical protein